jgi:sugar lactone lactonase YvrE
MNDPYQLVAGWPSMPPKITWGQAIGLVPDGTGGLWLQHRSEPPILHFNAAGNVVASFGEGTFVQAHGLCRDRSGNFWALDSGVIYDTPSAAGRGFQIFKFSPDGKLLMTLGKAGVSKAGRDTFLGPSGCVVAPNGDLLIADGHWPRPPSAQQDGDRLVRLSSDGTFISEYGKLGSGPGEFVGPHGLAFDSQGRLFVADRSNNRIQIFDKDMKFVDDWRHFGRPSNLVITKDDTLYVVDSESGRSIDGSPAAPEGRGVVPRNPGWKNGIRIGSAKDGSLRFFIPNTRPEGLAVDERGNVFAGLTSACDVSRGCLQKYVKK